MTQYRILGIDPGSKITGFCILAAPYSTQNGLGMFQPSLIKVIDAGVIRPHYKLSHSERAGQLHNTLHQIVTEQRPHVCVIERAFTGINPNSALRLGETRGALISAVRRLNIDVEELSPTQIKKITTGQGHATKEQIARAMQTLLGFERGNLPFDVTDAMAIALSHALSVPPTRQHMPYAESSGKKSDTCAT